MSSELVRSQRAELALRLGLPDGPPRPHRYYELARKRLSLEGRDVAYVSLGEGPPLLLVHGLMTSSYSFRYILHDLARDYSVLCPDLPGAGQSAKDSARPHTPSAMSAFLKGFLDALGVERARVVGNSLGGLCALRFTADHPERVLRLAVMHAPGFPELRVALMRALLAVPALRNGFARYLRRNRFAFVARNVHYAQPLMSAEEVLEYAGIFETREGCRTFIRILRDALIPAELSDLHQRLAGNSRLPPTLLLWARRDPMVSPKFGPRFQALMPHAQLIWMDGVSHFMHVDDPQATLRHLQPFLTGRGDQD
jgi:pimeloyl-ACP methyl ester carboxylesterase